jgi:hypothetical protein
MSGGYFQPVPCQPGPVCSDARGADTLSECGSPWPGLGRRTLSPSVVADRLPDAAEVERRSLYGSCRFWVVPFDYQAKGEAGTGPVGADDDGVRPADGAHGSAQAGDCVTATACGSL